VKELTSHREYCLSTDVLSRFGTEFGKGTLLNLSGDCIGVSENGVRTPTALIQVVVR